MTFRSDHDAAVSRVQALEREVAQERARADAAEAKVAELQRASRQAPHERVVCKRPHAPPLWKRIRIPGGPDALNVALIVKGVALALLVFVALIARC